MNISPFKQFRHKGKTLLAVPSQPGSGIAVMDSEGYAYGSFFSIDSFKKFIARNGGLNANRIYRCRVEFADRTPIVDRRAA